MQAAAAATTATAINDNAENEEPLKAEELLHKATCGSSKSNASRNEPLPKQTNETSFKYSSSKCDGSNKTDGASHKGAVRNGSNKFSSADNPLDEKLRHCFLNEAMEIDFQADMAIEQREQEEEDGKDYATLAATTQAIVQGCSLTRANLKRCNQKLARLSLNANQMTQNQIINSRASSCDVYSSSEASSLYGGANEQYFLISSKKSNKRSKVEETNQTECIANRTRAARAGRKRLPFLRRSTSRFSSKSAPG